MRRAVVLLGLALLAATVVGRKPSMKIHPQKAMAASLKKLSHPRAVMTAMKGHGHAIDKLGRRFAKLQTTNTSSTPTSSTPRPSTSGSSPSTSGSSPPPPPQSGGGGDGGMDIELYDPRSNVTCQSADFQTAQNTLVEPCAGFRYLDEANYSTVMSTFCSSSCKTAIEALIPRWGPCLGGETRRPVWECNNRPQCLSTGFFTAMRDLDTSCAAFDADALFDIDNTTAAAKAAATAACGQTTCITTATNLINGQYGVCADPMMRVMVRSVPNLCRAGSDGTVCANTLKDISQMFGTCESLRNSTACGAATGCAWDAEDMTCDAVVTEARLRPICGDCFNSFIQMMQNSVDAMVDYVLEEFRINGVPEALAGEFVREIRSSMRSEFDQLTSMRDLFCSQVGGTYCYPLVMAETDAVNFDVLFNVESPNMTYAQSINAQTRLCANRTIRGCTQRVMGIFSSFRVRETNRDLRRCVSDYYSYVGGTQYTQQRAEACVRRADQDMREIASFGTQMEFLCKSNDENQYCLSMMRLITSDTTGCFNSIIRASTPSCAGAGCDAWAVNVTGMFGCCMNELSTLFTNRSEAYDVGLLSRVEIRGANGQLTETVVTPAPVRRTPVPWDQHPLKPFASCTSLSGAAFQTNATRECAPKVQAFPRRTLKLRILWNAVNSDAALKARLEAALQQDLSNALLINVLDIVNGTLIENTANALTVTSTGTAARRQAGSSTTASSSSYDFKVGGTNQEDANAAAATYDQKSSDGSLAQALPSTSSAILSAPTLTQGVEGSADGELYEAPPASAGAVSTLLAAVLALVALLL